MESEKSGVKKIIAPTIIAIVTMIALTVGATYAYFTVGTTNSFTSATATASVNDIGSVTLTTTNSSLSMSLTATQMLSSASGTTYYATTSGTASTTATNVTIGTLTVDAQGTYSCTLGIKVSLTSDTMITALKSSGSTGQVKFYIQGTAYDAYSTTITTTTAYTTSVTITGITSSSSKTLTGGLSVTNTSSDQTDYLAGTSTTLTYEVTSMTCSLTSG